MSMYINQRHASGENKSETNFKVRPLGGHDNGSDLDSDCLPGEDPSKRQMTNLLKIVESDIIPNLVISHHEDDDALDNTISEASEKASSPSNHILSDQVESLTQILLYQDLPQAEAMISELIDAEVSVNDIYLQLFAATARHLGVLWEEDMVNFTEVTIAVGRLQELLRELSSANRYQPSREHQRRILLTPVPGEQHTFGMSMLIEFFCNAGWEVWGWPGVNEQNLENLVKREWFHVVGLSMYAEIHEQTLLETIRDIKEHSRNPDVKILVGGYAFEKNPDLVSLVGASEYASDANQALAVAEALSKDPE